MKTLLRIQIRDFLWLLVLIALICLVFLLNERNKRDQSGSGLEEFARSRAISIFRNLSKIDSNTLIKVPANKTLVVAIGTSVIGTNQFEMTDSFELKPGLWNISISIEETSSSRKLKCECLENSQALEKTVNGTISGFGSHGIQSGWMTLASKATNKYGFSCVELGNMHVMFDNEDEVVVSVILKEARPQ